MLAAQTVFSQLVLGLALYTQEQSRYKNSYPPGLLQAMSHIALAKGERFPKTISAFIGLCGTPLGEWYPDADTMTDFSPRYKLLDAFQLTEQASDYLYSLPDSIIQASKRDGFIPQTVMDNWQIQQFIAEMQQMADVQAAQHIYSAVRSFIVEHSWLDRNTLRELTDQAVPQEIMDRIRQDFYEQGTDTPFYVCDRCGILRCQNEQWKGIKPRFCDDHHNLQAPHIHTITRTSYLRLRAGLQLRTFIPGQAELTLFTEAEALHNEYPDQFVAVLRYPGLDAYDLQLKFRDETWAVDVKDIADPLDLSRKIAPLPAVGDLSYDKAFYVVPDHRLASMPDYLEQVHHYAAYGIEPPLFLLSTKVFISRMREKCEALIKASR